MAKKVISQRKEHDFMDTVGICYFVLKYPKSDIMY